MNTTNPGVIHFLIGKNKVHRHWLTAGLSLGAIIAVGLLTMSAKLVLTIIGIVLGLRLVNLYDEANPVFGFTAAEARSCQISHFPLALNSNAPAASALSLPPRLR